jgi:hypothetical protein
MNFDNLVKINTKKVVRDIPKITKPSNIVCTHFHHGKQSRDKFNTKEYKTSKSLELVHTNIYGLTRTKIMQMREIIYSTH